MLSRDDEATFLFFGLTICLAAAFGIMGVLWAVFLYIYAHANANT